MARQIKRHELPAHRPIYECICPICNKLVKDIPFLVLWSKEDPNKIEGYAHVDCIPHHKESET